MGGPSPHHHLPHHHPHHSHPAIVTPGVRQDLHADSNHRYFTEFYVDYFSPLVWKNINKTNVKIKWNSLLSCLGIGGGGFVG